MFAGQYNSLVPNDLANKKSVLHSPTNFGFYIFDCRGMKILSRFIRIYFSIENLKSAIENSFNDLVGPIQQRLWDSDADLLRRLQVNDQLKLFRLFHR